MSPTTCFQETPLRPRLTTPKVFYASRKDISLWEGHRKSTRHGGCHVYTQAILEEIRHLSYLILNISLFGIIPFYNRLNFCSEHKQLPKGIKERLL
jgi:hypothetical protein